MTAACAHAPECGCEHAECCLECPLPVCKYDAPQGTVGPVADERRERDAEIVRLVRLVGRIGAASSLGVSMRTVNRALVAARRQP